jgi:hypothetical protein
MTQKEQPTPSAHSPVQEILRKHNNRRLQKKEKAHLSGPEHIHHSTACDRQKGCSACAGEESANEKSFDILSGSGSSRKSEEAEETDEVDWSPPVPNRCQKSTGK